VGAIKRTNSISEPYFFFVTSNYPELVDCVQSVNKEIGEDLAVCSIEIEKIDASLFRRPGQDRSGRLDTPLFEIDSFKFAVSDCRIMRISDDLSIGEAMGHMKNLAYLVDIHAHYNERKGCWGHLKVFVHLPHDLTDI